MSISTKKIAFSYWHINCLVYRCEHNRSLTRITFSEIYEILLRFRMHFHLDNVQCFLENSVISTLFNFLKTKSGKINLSIFFESKSRKQGLSKYIL